ncbi:hypothetical protein HYH03_000455 [Edaphochlamys debaryana]|uniref:dolichol kinase n=1 Tax=Edaphochlamys debaryana TaxID=47281 RepID=A0A836C7N6_9CHLO|nr:hypothetical protein HYH03_000455 [Edaphochlamys debaryana]|eukprot:KAG2501957.1 hypothetical protein HYH03_000455 [Edaphochlamys debaryana]
MVFLAVLTLVLDLAGPAWFKGHPLYAFRACSQAGLAQGLLALPTLATAIAIATRSWWWQQLAHLLLASSFQLLLWLAWAAATGATPGAGAPTLAPAPSAPASSGGRSNGASAAPSIPRGAGGARRPWLRPLFSRGGAAATSAYLVATGVGCAASALAALLHGAVPPPPTSPRLLLPGSVFELPRDIALSAAALQAALLLASVPAFDHLAQALPRSLTPGEAGVLLQALAALAAGGGAYLAGAARHGRGVLGVLWSLHVVQPDPGMHVPAFVVMALFWVLLLAASAAVATGGRGQSPGGSEAGDKGTAGKASAAGEAGPVEGSATGAGAGAGAGSARADPARTKGAHVRRRAAAPAVATGEAGEVGDASGSSERAPAPPPTPGQGGPEGPGPEKLPPAARLAAAVLAGVCLLMLLDLALWVLGRFVAASSRPRLATLAYWFGCLAVAVPAMYGISKASAVVEAEKRAAQEEGAGADSNHALDRPRRGGQAAATNGTHALAAAAAALAAPSTDASGEAAAGAGRRAASRPPAPPPLHPLLRLLAVPHIVMRKGYHLLAILLFLPAFGWDVRMLQASLGVAGAVLVAAEGLRCLGPARLRAAIAGFMRDFADARDSGPVYVTHFTLLLGIALPVWLCDPVCGAAAGAMMAGLYGSEAAAPMQPPAAAGAAAEAPPLSAAAAALLPSCRTLLGLSGLVSLGSGDTAAACVGFLLGRRRLFAAQGWRKTWEGTASGVAAMLLSWVVAVWWMDVGWALGWRAWGGLAAVTLGVALLEAVTAQLDNVVVPLYYLAHLVLLVTGN